MKQVVLWAVASLWLCVGAGLWLWRPVHGPADQRSELARGQAAQWPGSGLPEFTNESVAAPRLNRLQAKVPSGALGRPAADLGKTSLSSRSVTPSPSPRRSAWDPEFLNQLASTRPPDAIRFELVDGETASGFIQQIERTNGRVQYLAGRLVDPEQGRFFFQRQTRPGVAGDFVGVVEFPVSQRAYRLEPTGPGHTTEMVERPLESVVCRRLPAPGRYPGDVAEIPPLDPGHFPAVPIPAYQGGILVLESQPGAGPVIYLDFQGGYTPRWGGISYDRPSVSNEQIREVWRRVAEDFLPFNLNVTTDRKVFEQAPEGGRQRVIITPTTSASPEAGGVAYYNSFNWTGDLPCWVFITSGKACAEAIAHELGHTLGLSHQGIDIGGNHTEYYPGHGSGETSWAPLMGVGYDADVTQWSDGEYANANNPEDELALITTRNNGVGFRPDDTGDTLATSRYLELYSDYTAGAEGVIERTDDTDAFQFTTPGGAVSLRADPAETGPNLALQVALYDANDVLLAADSPRDRLWASLSTNLPAGTYTLRVSGAGRGDPLTDGFSSYASLGYYSVTGSVANARLPNRFALAEHTPGGTVVGQVPALHPGSDPLTYRIVSGNPSNTFAIDNSGVLTVANNALLDYEALARQTQLAIQFELFVDIADRVNPDLDEHGRRVVVAVTNINEPPILGDLSIPVPEHTPLGTIIARLEATDPDFYTLLAYLLLGGNSNGMFTVDATSGGLTVLGDLNAATQSVYRLTIGVSDQNVPVPLVTTSTVTVLVDPPYPRGSVSCALYTNIPGSLVDSLTNHPSFPHQPACEQLVTLFEAASFPDDRCGVVLRGYLLPRETGSYTFWLASGGNGELWFGGSPEPGEMRCIASIGGGGWAEARQWEKYPSQQSPPILLEMGHAYYIEARMKADVGNNLAVAWECAGNGLARQVIPGEFLAGFAMEFGPYASGFSTDLRRNAITGTRVGVVLGTNLHSQEFPTFAVVSGNEAGLFSIEPLTGIVRVADEAGLRRAAPTNYVLEVQATDQGLPPRSSSASVTVHLLPAEGIICPWLQQEIWTNLPGVAVSNLTRQPDFPKRPQVLRPLPGLDSGSQSFGVEYGSRLRAWVTPPASGDYTFFIASSDSSQLLLSPDTNAATATVIASVEGATSYREWTRYTSQRAPPVFLQAGSAYYLEVLHKAAGGHDHVEVGWAGPGLAGTNVIPSSCLTPVDIGYAPELPERLTNSLVWNAPTGALVTTLAALSSPLNSVTYKILAGNSNNTFTLAPDTGQLRVADRTLLGRTRSFSLVIQAQDSGYGGLYPLQSCQVTLEIQIPAAPSVWTGGGTNDNWSTDANWNGLYPIEGRELVFQGKNRQTNYNDVLTEVGTVRMRGAFCLRGKPLRFVPDINDVIDIESTGTNTWAIDFTITQDEVYVQNLGGRLTLANSITNDAGYLMIESREGVLLQGVLSGSGSLRAGGLVVSSTNTYTGPTTCYGTLALTGTGDISSSSSIRLQGGTLDVNAKGGGFAIPDHQTLEGWGAVAGSLRVDGCLAPDSNFPWSDRPSITFSNDVVLAGTTRITKDRVMGWAVVQVLGKLTCGGTLNVSVNQVLRRGNIYRLFRAGTLTGAFDQLDLPALSSGLVWDTSWLMVDGTLRVAPAQVPIQSVVLGDQLLTLNVRSLPTRRYILEATPTLSPAYWAPLSTNLADSETLLISAPFDPNTPQQFFRVSIDSGPLSP